MNRALLLIDFEEEWRTRGSEAYLGDLHQTIANARPILEAGRTIGLPVIFTRHEEPPDATIFRPESAGVRLVPELVPRADETVYVKHKISPFYGTPLEEHLARGEIGHLVIGGIMTNLCVRSAVADAYDRSLGITVVTDACASDSPTTDQFTFEDLRRTRPEVRFATTDEWVREVRSV